METISENGVTVITVPQRVDANNAREFEIDLKAIIEGGSNRLVCDFASNEYISSAGLRVFLVILKLLNKSGDNITLCCLQPQVKSVFDMAGFTRLFNIFESREEALQKK